MSLSVVDVAKKCRHCSGLQRFERVTTKGNRIKLLLRVISGRIKK